MPSLLFNNFEKQKFLQCFLIRSQIYSEKYSEKIYKTITHKKFGSENTCVKPEQASRNHSNLWAKISPATGPVMGDPCLGKGH